MSGKRIIENKPAVNKNLLEKGALMQQQNFVAIKAKSTIPTYIIPSSTCPKELANKEHYAALATTQWNSFDTYINHGYQISWIAQISAELWDTQSTCTCPVFFKQNICKHIVALAIREGLLKNTDNCNPTLISATRKKAGRPKHAQSALVKQ